MRKEAPVSDAVESYHDAVHRFKREFLSRMLAAHGGNRTWTARAIGLQRTYLLRLIREFGLNQPSNGKPGISLPSVSSR